MPRPECYRQLHASRAHFFRHAERRKGLFLLRALLVVLGLSGIMVIVVPRYVSAQKEGNEVSVRSLLRTIVVLNRRYRRSHPTYADSLESLAKEYRIQTVIEAAARSNYFIMYRGGRNTWSCVADPQLHGTAHFFVDESGAIRSRADARATANDPEVD